MISASFRSSSNARLRIWSASTSGVQSKMHGDFACWPNASRQALIPRQKLEYMNMHLTVKRLPANRRIEGLLLIAELSSRFRNALLITKDQTLILLGSS
jgi:hypothetical protein